ncbi:Hydrolase [Entamoeba marina]
MNGSLHVLDNHVSYFITGKHNEDVPLIILLSGLTDTLFSVEYFQQVAKELQHKYYVCSPSLRSSGSGFGYLTIWDDIEDIDKVLQHITTTYKSTNIVIVGHSTGCQDIMILLQLQLHKKYPIKKCVLQAPVSDRDAVENDSEIKKVIEEIENKYQQPIKDLVHNKTKTELISTKYLYDDKYFVSEDRFLSLIAPGGDEDWFSYDIMDYSTKFKCIDIPCLFVFCLNDEYVPLTTKLYKELIERIDKSNEFIRTHTYEDDHSLTKSSLSFIQLLQEFIE